MSEVFIEIQRNGAYLKCTAIDADTGEEVVVIGPLREPESLKRLAVQKLRHKQGLKPQPPKGGGSYNNGSGSSGTDIKV
jgi:hypothetical protein